MRTLDGFQLLKATACNHVSAVLDENFIRLFPNRFSFIRLAVRPPVIFLLYIVDFLFSYKIRKSVLFKCSLLLFNLKKISYIILFLLSTNLFDATKIKTNTSLQHLQQQVHDTWGILRVTAGCQILHKIIHTLYMSIAFVKQY